MPDDRSRGRGAVTCVVADDHGAMLSSLASLLEQEGFAVVGAAATGREAVLLLASCRPALAVLDVRLGDMTGIEVAREAASLGVDTAIVLHTAECGAQLVRDALAAGIRCVARKDVPPLSLLNAITAAVAGNVYVDPAFGRFSPRVAR